MIALFVIIPSDFIDYHPTLAGRRAIRKLRFVARGVKAKFRVIGSHFDVSSALLTLANQDEGTTTNA